MSGKEFQSLLPSFSFSTSELPSRSRLDAWNDQLALFFEASSVGEEVQGGIDASVLGNMAFGTTLLSAQAFRRDKHRVAYTNMDHYLVQLYTEGGCHGQAANREIAMQPGDMVIFDLAETIHTQVPKSSNISAVVPRAMVDLHLSATGDCHTMVLSGKSEPGSLLAHHFRRLVKSVPRLDVAEAEAMSRATAELVASCIGASKPGTDYAVAPLRRALFERVADYIDAHLHAPTLSPEEICRVLRISRPHLYRAFSQFGGVAKYILNRRLRQTAIELQRPENRGQTIGVIAYRCGFTSEAHFSRVFKESFGIRPKDAREAFLVEGDSEAARQNLSRLLSLLT